MEKKGKYSTKSAEETHRNHGEAKPGETKPGETKPGETKPGETKRATIWSERVVLLAKIPPSR
jgi:hypothetical protein